MSGQGLTHFDSLGPYFKYKYYFIININESNLNRWIEMI